MNSHGVLFNRVQNNQQEINMPDEITVKPKSETTQATPTIAEQQNQTVTLSRAHIISLCALGLGVCFFLPWISILRGTASGFDLQKLGDLQRLLWLIPIMCAITIFAGVIKQGQQIAGQLSGAVPFLAGIYWYLKIGNDMFQILTFGAYLSLAFGAALLVLSRKSK